MEPITQDTLDPISIIGDSNKLLDSMDIENTYNKIKEPTPLIETEHYDEVLYDIEPDANLKAATNIRSSTRKSQLSKIL